MLTQMSEEDWDVVLMVFRAVLPRRGDKGRDDRKFLKALHYFTVHNITWRALPAEFGGWNAVWKRFWRLSRSGVFEAMFEALAAASTTAHLVQMLDSTTARAHVSAAGAKGGRTAKLSAARAGPVDEFGEDEHKAESDEGSVVPGGFLATQSNALEALELSDALLDAGASAVERFRKESGSVLGIRLGGNDGADAAGSGGLAVGLAVVALVADNGARRDVRPEVEQDREVPAVARLPGGQVEGDRQAAEVGLEVDLGREAAARAAKSLAVLPPFEPAADTCARAVVESSICTRWAVELVAASASNMASNTPDRLRVCFGI